MNDSGSIRTETATPNGPVEHQKYIHSRYLIEQEQEVDRNQRNPKFNPQPMGNLTPSTGHKVKHSGVTEPVVKDETITKELKKDLRKRNIKNK